jgi:hypothetical protein
VDSKSLPMLLAAAKGAGVASSTAARVAACSILAAAMYCTENIAAAMHAGAGKTMVTLVMECGSTTNNMVGDAAEKVIRRLISVGGALSDAPMTLVRAEIEGAILLERLRLAPPQGRVLMGAVLQRLVFESYNTRAASDTDAVLATAAHSAAKSALQLLWHKIPPLPLSAMPSIEPHIVKTSRNMQPCARHARLPPYPRTRT